MIKHTDIFTFCLPIIINSRNHEIMQQVSMNAPDGNCNLHIDCFVDGECTNNQH